MESFFSAGVFLYFYEILPAYLSSTMPNFPSGFLIASLCTIALSTGCGTSGPELGSVSGTVTLDGVPLSGVLVVFNPGNSRPSEGLTDANGYYELRYTREQSGAIVGQHKVLITPQVTVDQDGNETVGDQKTIPVKYNTETTLSEEVKSGSNIFNFDLQS